ncbi:LPXTG cell wall anchor domain-containing protein [Candidatus Woesearchaeota archaeon]|nr:LPXTG cell wall anchor domain-containing protein [Candidatus Woesearchaeota archaeon]
MNKKISGKNIIMFALMILFLIPLVSAAWVQPLDCDKLTNEEFISKTEYTEEEMFCFYGSGYQEGEEVKVSLENEERKISGEYSASKGGILTSINSFINNLVAGVYNLFVRGESNTVQYSEKIIVRGEDPEIPEFTTIAAGLVLIGAGIIISKKRKQNE